MIDLISFCESFFDVLLENFVLAVIIPVVLFTLFTIKIFFVSVDEPERIPKEDR